MRLTSKFNLNQWTVVSISVFFAALITWSFWAELEQVSRAPGQAIPTGRIQIIQSSDGGVIADIKVREGDQVQKDQLLVLLDQVKVKAAVSESQGKVASLMSSMARINAELFDRPLEFPPEVRAYPHFMANQSMLYQKRRQALQDTISALQGMLRLAEQELDLNRPLVATGDVARADVLRMERSVSDLKAQIVNVRNKYLQDLQTEYTKTEEDLVAAREILAQRSDMLKDTEIRAPVAGIVKNVRLTTIGGVLRPGDEVLSLVPTGDTLIVEARVSPSDIAYVRMGQTAAVKFDAYDSSIYGGATGKVIYVSPDTIAESKASGDTVYYRVHTSVDTRSMKTRHAAEKIEIQPGMTATVEIQTGKNTVFRYLAKPITKTFGDAMEER